MKLDLEYYRAQGSLFKALNHPIRLAILDILRQGEACVCHMEAVLGQRQAYISQQLSVLREAGIIEDRRDGWNVFYQIADPKIFELVELSRQFVITDQDQAMTFESKNCPCPKCSSRKRNAVVTGHSIKNE